MGGGGRGAGQKSDDALRICYPFEIKVNSNSRTTLTYINNVVIHTTLTYINNRCGYATPSRSRRGPPSDASDSKSGGNNSNDISKKKEEKEKSDFALRIYHRFGFNAPPCI